MLIWLGLTRSVIMNSKIKMKIYFETITSTLINRCLMENCEFSKSTGYVLHWQMYFKA